MFMRSCLLSRMRSWLPCNNDNTLALTWGLREVWSRGLFLIFVALSYSMSPDVLRKTNARARAIARKPIVIIMIIALIALCLISLYMQIQSSNESYKIENFNAIWNHSLADFRSGNTTIVEYCTKRVHDEDFCNRFSSLQYLNWCICSDSNKRIIDQSLPSMLSIFWIPVSQINFMPQDQICNMKLAQRSLGFSWKGWIYP